MSEKIKLKNKINALCGQKGGADEKERMGHDNR